MRKPPRLPIGETLAHIGSTLSGMVFAGALICIVYGEPIVPNARIAAIAIFGLVFCSLLIADGERGDGRG